MAGSDDLVSGIRALQLFLPAKNFALSLNFYQTLGFRSDPLGDGLASLSLGPHGFLLQDFYVKDCAENMMMHVLVDDVQAWWRHIEPLDLAGKFGVQPPRPPKAEDWGLTLVYVFDPVGTLWHFAAVTQK